LGHNVNSPTKLVLFRPIRQTVHPGCAPARLDNTVDAEIRRLATIDVLIIDDFALRPLGATETSDFYEIIVERHPRQNAIGTSNREPSEWLTMTADTLLAQSAIDRLTPPPTPGHRRTSYRQRTDPASLTQTTPTSILNNAPRWSIPLAIRWPPSPWQATCSSCRGGDPVVVSAKDFIEMPRLRRQRMTGFYFGPRSAGQCRSPCRRRTAVTAQGLGRRRRNFTSQIREGWTASRMD